MTRTASTMRPLGSIATDFELIDVVTGKKIRLKDGAQYIATVLLFICNHCPYVKHINQALVNLSKKYIDQSVRFLAINSNDVESYPDDAPEAMQRVAELLHYPFPYLFDTTQEVARHYEAACTPDFFVFNSAYELVYRGQFDDSRPQNSIPVTGYHLAEALDCLLEAKAITVEQKPSLGCNIKWKESAHSCLE